MAAAWERERRDRRGVARPVLGGSQHAAAAKRKRAHERSKTLGVRSHRLQVAQNAAVVLGPMHAAALPCVALDYPPHLSTILLCFLPPPTGVMRLTHRPRFSAHVHYRRCRPVDRRVPRVHRGDQDRLGRRRRGPLGAHRPFPASASLHRRPLHAHDADGRPREAGARPIAPSGARSAPPSPVARHGRFLSRPRPGRRRGASGGSTR